MINGPQIVETERLMLRPIELSDGDFVLALVNEPGWLRYIGDKGIRTLADAARYIEHGPQAMYRKFGFGLLVVTVRSSAERIGLCGLLQREWLKDVDLGFALLEQFHGQGYAYEAASALLLGAKRTHGLERVVAITSLDNAISGKLLEKLGFQLESEAPMGPDLSELKLYGRAL
jgi:RimJ/RimL family protein N-acetyltransferase